jgi:hypothetical protein
MSMQGTLGAAEAGAEIDRNASMAPYSPIVATAMIAGRFVVRDIVSPISVRLVGSRTYRLAEIPQVAILSFIEQMPSRVLPVTL